MTLAEKIAIRDERKAKQAWWMSLWELLVMWALLIPLFISTLIGIVTAFQLGGSNDEIYINIFTNIWWCAPGLIIAWYRERIACKKLDL